MNNRVVLVIVLLILLVGCQTVPKEQQPVTFEQKIEATTIRLSLYNLNTSGSAVNQITIIPSNQLRVEGRVSPSLSDSGFSISYDDSTLVIKTDTNRNIRDFYLDLTIYAPVSQLALEGSFEVDYDQPVGPSLTIDIAGAAKMEITNLDHDLVQAHLEGAGSFSLAGKAKTLVAVIEGAGEMNALDLDSEIADLRIEGAGSIRAKVSQQLKARIAGLGHIGYQGNPELDAKVDGLGAISKID